MSTTGFIPTGLEGHSLHDAQRIADELHFEKNRPEPPMMNGRPLQFPAYQYRQFPAAMYGPWTDDARRRAVQQTAAAYGLNPSKQEDRAEIEARVPEWDSRLVADDAERAIWEARGWAHSPDDVKAAQITVQEAVFQEAAERAHIDQRLSDKARAEFDAADRANGDTPLVDLPVPKKRGRPVTVTARGV